MPMNDGIKTNEPGGAGAPYRAAIGNIAAMH